MLLEGLDSEGTGTDGIELFNDFAGHAMRLDTDQAGFGWGLTAETPKGGGHFKNESILDRVGGFPIVEVGVEEDLELGKFFAWEDEFLDVSSVGDGVEGRSAFAFGGFRACGFQRIEARGEFAFVVCSHCVYRIADRLKDTTVKCFRILEKWLVTQLRPGWKNAPKGFSNSNFAMRKVTQSMG